MIHSWRAWMREGDDKALPWHAHPPAPERAERAALAATPAAADSGLCASSAAAARAAWAARSPADPNGLPAVAAELDAGCRACCCCVLSCASAASAASNTSIASSSRLLLAAPCPAPAEMPPIAIAGTPGCPPDAACVAGAGSCCCAACRNMRGTKSSAGSAGRGPGRMPVDCLVANQLPPSGQADATADMHDISKMLADRAAAAAAAGTHLAARCS